MLSLNISAVLFLALGLFANCAAQCPLGWAHSEETGKCYKHMREPLAWQDAQNSCKSEGARLAAIHNPTENKWISEFASIDNAHRSLGDLELSEMWFPWIGYRAPNDDCSFQWTDKHLTRWTNWQNETTMEQHCLQERCVCLTALRAHPAYGTWFTAPCEENGPYLCEMVTRKDQAEL